MVDFKVHGPLTVPTEKGKGGKQIEPRDGRQMLEDEGVGDEVGCYIFCMRTGRAVTPYYVGMTATSFRNECFKPHKVSNYYTCMASYGKGTPVLFFLSAPRGRGSVNRKQIKELETFLINTCNIINDKLLNKRENQTPKWSVAGVIRSTGRGKPSKAAMAFRKMLKR